MARRSPLAPLVLALGFVGATYLCMEHPRTSAFLPTPAAGRAARELSPVEAAQIAALPMAAAVATHPLAALAGEDDDDAGNDFPLLQILITFSPPLIAASWAIFNMFRTFFRGVQKLDEVAPEKA